MQDGTLEDNIPSRSCDCVSDMCCSPTRSVYLLSDDEVAQLINHEKVNWIRKSPLFNQDVVEQRKLTQEAFPDTFTNRYKFNIESVRNDSDTTLSSDTLDYTQWGLLSSTATSKCICWCWNYYFINRP